MALRLPAALDGQKPHFKIVGIDYCQFSVGCKPDTGAWSAGSWNRFVPEKRQLGIYDAFGWVDVLRLPFFRLPLGLPLGLPLLRLPILRLFLRLLPPVLGFRVFLLRRLSIRGFYGLLPVWAPAKNTDARIQAKKVAAELKIEEELVAELDKLTLETPSEDIQDDISVLTEALEKLKVKEALKEKKSEGWVAKVKRYVASFL
ncbi:MAG: hypothetical protein LQ350_003343 [Teloschistes chrysophthalmus]|nr:MAG: hypothetical protein LQ350_003343 [Niorma chrysophthalma]